MYKAAVQVLVQLLVCQPNTQVQFMSCSKLILQGENPLPAANLHYLILNMPMSACIETHSNKQKQTGLIKRKK